MSMEQMTPSYPSCSQMPTIPHRIRSFGVSSNRSLHSNGQWLVTRQFHCKYWRHRHLEIVTRVRKYILQFRRDCFDISKALFETLLRAQIRELIVLSQNSNDPIPTFCLIDQLLDGASRFRWGCWRNFRRAGFGLRLFPWHGGLERGPRLQDLLSTHDTSAPEVWRIDLPLVDLRACLGQRPILHRSNEAIRVNSRSTIPWMMTSKIRGNTIDDVEWSDKSMSLR